jgi:transcriptional regulator with XRE-family HTH domain
MKNKELVNYLRKKGYKGQRLAEALGVTKATVSKAEHDLIKNPSMKMLENAATALHLKPFELLKLIEIEKIRGSFVQNLTA